MYFSTAHLAAASAALAQAAITIPVQVGKGGALTFVPNDIKANVGDSIEFSFFPKNHSVTQSSFADPCHPLAGGFFSTFIPTNSSESSETFTIVVNDTKPIWIYCAQTVKSHCQSGMVASINAPATGNTLAAFTLKASNATDSTSPPNTVPLGGILAVKGKGTGVTTSIATTVTTTVTRDGSTYATTYATAYGTTYTTDATQQVSTSGVSGSSPTKSSGAGSTSVSTTAQPGAATALTANGAMVGAMMLGALAML
ncbi:Cupredoxin [Hyaloscypha bicolor E]|uniref:Cupredoxin n=1 Tax=Hyaloscypha bicolor E TaxID=1095630 RepID=A0A2J6SVQ0_9HELO|nr:Cupredoxin [Hyaloscypha bicolor E]PMD54855.1 Cupredoxin [Hyaloscypha bicolor E]